MDFNQIFKDSFDTFKAFDNLTIEQASQTSDKTPKTVWQILNHLTVWQDYQLQVLRDKKTDVEINEVDTWVGERSTQDQLLLNERINKFKQQLDAIKSEINNLNKADFERGIKVKIIQDMAVHLSFHLGEIVLLRRIFGNYPWPNEMRAFLNQD